MNLLNFLKLGMALFLSFSNPAVDYSSDCFVIKTELSNMLTDDMIILLNSGMDLNFQIYTSLRNEKNKSNIIINRYYKRISFDRIKNQYIVNDGEDKIYNKLNAAINDLKKFEFKYLLDINQDRIDYSFFCQISILPDEFMESTTNIKTMELWSYYKPSVKYNFYVGE